MNEREHHPDLPSSRAQAPRDHTAAAALVRPWARAIDGNENPILAMTEEQISQLERRLGRPIDV